MPSCGGKAEIRCRKTCHRAVGQCSKKIRTDCFGKRWKRRACSAMQKYLLQGFDGRQRSVGQMRFEQIASRLRCAARHSGAQSGDASPSATTGGVLSPAGLTWVLGPLVWAQLCSSVAAALQTRFRVLWHELLWIPLCGIERPCISSAHMGCLWKGTAYLFVLAM